MGMEISYKTNLFVYPLTNRKIYDKLILELERKCVSKNKYKSELETLKEFGYLENEYPDAGPLWYRLYPSQSKEDKRRHTIKHNYGLSWDSYLALLEKQNSCCAICGVRENADKSLDIDHDHTTGKVRGLLCGHCNRGLGNFKDSTELLENAVKYLNENKTLDK